MKYSEKWGDSVDIAVELALVDLKLTRDQVNVTILEEPSRGFFGIGSKLAKVRVEEKPKQEKAKEVKEPAAAKEVKPKQEKAKEVKPKEQRPRKKEAAPDAPEPYQPERKIEITKDGKQEVLIEVCGMEEPDEEIASAYRFQREKRARSQARKAPEKRTAPPSKPMSVLHERPDNLEEVQDHLAGTFICEMIEKMGSDVTVKVYEDGETVYVDIEGPDSGTIIGKRGQTLDAIQYLTSLVVNKGKEGYTRVIIDAEGYRKKRERTLQKLANRLADKVNRTGRSIRLEPMNPYERKIIHTALQTRGEVGTRSEGEEPYRRVIIEPQN